MDRCLGVLVAVWLSLGAVAQESAALVAGHLADLRSPSAAVRSRAAQGLAKAHDPAVIPALIVALGDAEAKVRQAAARSLGEQRKAEAVPSLLKALGDADGNVRFYAAHALGEIKDKAAAEGLLAALRDPVYGVRDEAAWALRELHDPSIGQALLPQLARDDADIPHISWLVQHVVGEGAIPALTDLLKNENPVVRGRALSLLIGLKSRQAVPSLILALADSDRGLRLQALQTLVETRDDRAIPALRALVAREPDAELRELASEGVRRLTMHPSIVAYWSFDGCDGKTVRNEVPIGGDGEIKGAKLVPGKIGQGLQCGPDQYVELGQPAMLPIATRPLTFTAWIRPTGPTGVVIARGGAFSGFSLYLKEGHPVFGIHLEKDGPTYLATGEKTVPLGEWLHLAGVVREKSVEVWVNGTLAATVETPGYLLNNAGQGMEIGFDAGNSPCELVDAFPGVIDEVRMYHAALTGDDIRQQYEREK